MERKKGKVRIPRTLTREFSVDVGERQTVERAEGEPSELYPISISSELPVQRWSWDGPYYEVLSHVAGDVDLSRAEGGLAALKNHDSAVQVGSVSGIKLDTGARRLRGMLGFSSIRDAEDQKTLVDEGHLRTISVGYRVLGLTLTKTDEDGVPTYLAKWAPLEVSLVPVPADATVGVGRSGVEAIRSVAADDLAEFTVADHRVEEEPAVPEKGERMDPEKKGTDVLDVGTPAAPVRDHRAEAVEISEVCNAHGRGDKIAEYLGQDLSPGQVRKIILDEIRTSGPAQPASESLAELPTRDASRYSVRRALAIQSGIEKRDGIEAELHDELSRDGGANHGGILVPWRLRKSGDPTDYSRRTLGTTEPTGGATLVDEVVMPDMIDLLRNKTRVLELGAQFYPGLSGVVQMNKKTGAPTVEWMGENPASGATASQPTYGYVTMSPKTLIGTVEVPRQLLTMASIDVEADIRMELALGHATAFDLAAIHGSGTAKEPTGIYAAADVQAQAYTAVPDLPELTTAVGLVADVNADFGALAWITTPLMAALMSRTPLIGTTYPKFIWDGKISDGEMIGYKAVASSQVSKTLEAAAKHGLIFGNWNQITLGVWGNDLELVVDELTLATKGQIKITSFSMADVAIRQPQAFVKGTGATIV